MMTQRNYSHEEQRARLSNNIATVSNNDLFDNSDNLFDQDTQNNNVDENSNDRHFEEHANYHLQYGGHVSFKIIF